MLFRRDAARDGQGAPRLRRPLSQWRGASPAARPGHAGNAIVLLLAGQAGRPFDIDAELAARVLEVSGELELHNGMPVLRVGDWALKD
jgi:hypothetical protein